MTKPINEAIKRYFKTTTLHGFKYLCSPFYIDRICWVVWGAASALCAGALCAVLWARFLQMPALLTVQSVARASQPLPTVAVCAPPYIAVRGFLQNITTDPDKIERLSDTFERALRGMYVEQKQIEWLDDILNKHDKTLLEILYNYTPLCHDVMLKCRWRNHIIPCDKLFHKELTRWGICCVMRPNNSNKDMNKIILQGRNKLTLALRCLNESAHYGCEFLTEYDGEEWINPAMLAPGTYYKAQLEFLSVQDSDTEKLVGGNCVSNDDYSRNDCLVKCMENKCKCSDPLRNVEQEETDDSSFCSISQMTCLRASTKANTCDCLKPCKRIISDLSLERNTMENVNFTYDPIFSGLNVTSSVVLDLDVRVMNSRILTRTPTESWLTLLSSLGGVFNMFLGVGLFSALELIYFLIVMLPNSILKK